ncbi:MAG: hypothetical protein PHF24_10060 [Syntrophomonas sp.]|nr:hypothetical protein [Syntrophomonas sp.]
MSGCSGIRIVGVNIDVHEFDKVYVAAHSVVRIPCDWEHRYSTLNGDWRLVVSNIYRHYMDIVVDVNGSITGTGFYPFEQVDPQWCDWTIISGQVVGDSITFGIDYIAGLRNGNFYFGGTIQSDGSITGKWGTTYGVYNNGDIYSEYQNRTIVIR